MPTTDAAERDAGDGYTGPRRDANGDDMKLDEGATAEEDEEVGGLDDDAEDFDLFLVANDDTKCLINYKVAKMSILVLNSFEGDKEKNNCRVCGTERRDETFKTCFKCQTETDFIGQQICSKVDGETLERIVFYLNTAVVKGTQEIAKPIKSVKMDKITSEWEAKFINDLYNKSKRHVFEMILAANYMDIKVLLHLGCAKIATKIKGKSPEEIKKLLGDDEADQGVAAPEDRRRILNRLSA